VVFIFGKLSAHFNTLFFYELGLPTSANGLILQTPEASNGTDERNKVSLHAQ
jgi:hypothetical protein